ncbi:hypothetical protein GCM10022225_80080 [Plantactinospora mayteni]|uniref:Uncharacterized protein n=1 Tax=Plantactinospora mayteni TaxID=566021 RepID=A0ABQ4F375_9ACTN|nr:hypothetical protein Pma05_79290 [Plantactinospora mayteni]
MRSLGGSCRAPTSRWQDNNVAGLGFESQFGDHGAEGADTILEQDHMAFELADPFVAVGQLLL